MSNLSGKYLYHGTLRKMPTGFPNRKDGNWFATDPAQSILHAVQHSGSSDNRTPYLYIYKVINTPKLIKFETVNNFNKFAKGLGFKLEKKQKTFAFSGEDYSIARRLCSNGIYDGWWFPADQTQVVLCNPSRFLKFVKVLKINRPAKGWLNTRFKKGMFKNVNFNKVSTVPVKLNNVININQPSPNHMYLVSPRDGNEKLFDHNGNPVNMNKNTKTFNFKGKSYRVAGSLTLGRMSSNKATVVANRIKARTGLAYKINNVKEVSYQNKNNVESLFQRRERLQSAWLKKFLAPRKNNNNINASALYK